MIQDEKKYTWSEENVKLVKAEPAVYELYQVDELIYVGSTNDLSDRLTGYWSSKFNDDKCKNVTTSYKREYLPSETAARTKERLFLLEYQNAKGKLPRCNEKII